MSRIKRIIAAVLALTAVCCVCSSCNQSKTKTILTVDGNDVPAGVYLLYLTQEISALNEKIEEASFTGDKWSFTNDEIKNAKEWVKSEALQDTLELVAVEKKFAAMGLSFTPEEQSNLNSVTDYYWASIGATYEKMGISEASFVRVYKAGSMESEILEALYGEEGEQAITDDEYKAYMSENYSRVNHILVSSLDEEGDELTGDDLAAAEAKAKELLAASQEADEETFRTLIRENSKDYSESSDLDLGYVAPLENSGYVTEFEDAVKALKPGETSKELCKSQYGWHIIRRYEMFGDDLVNLDDYKATLRNTMKEDEFDAMKESWAKELKYTLVKASYDRYDPSDKKFAE